MQTMRPAEFTAARARASVAYVPIGPIEWHGPHLPLGMDGFHAHHVASEVAHRIGGIVLPTLFLGADSLLEAGTEPQGLANLGLADSARVTGMDFPGFPVKSLYIDESVLGVLLRDLLRALRRQGFRLVVLVNGHGAPNHQAVLRRLALESSHPDAPAVAMLTAWIPRTPSAASPGHADRFETSIMCATRAEDVDLGLLPPQPEPIRYADYGIVDGGAFDGHPQPGFAVPPSSDPRLSSAEEGITILAQEVDALAAAVASLLHQQVR